MSVISIGDALFTKTQQRVLGLLYGKPDQSFYTNEIVRIVSMGRGTVCRELERLVNAGILSVNRTGNQLHYQANDNNPVYKELLAIVQKTFGFVEVIQAALAPLKEEISLAFIYGSIAKGESRAESDIDLLVITEFVSYADLVEALMPAEQTIARPINPSIYNKAQILKKLKQKNAFVCRIMEQEKLWVQGCNDELGKLKQSSQNSPIKT